MTLPSFDLSDRLQELDLQFFLVSFVGSNFDALFVRVLALAKKFADALGVMPYFARIWRR